MIVAGALALVLGPLSLKPGFRSFPEIAELVGETPTDVKCDSRIAHRMAFVSAKTISREGLVEALGLKIVPDGKRRLMKSADESLEREWAGEVRKSLGRRYAQIVAAGLAAVNAEPRKKAKEDWMMPLYAMLTDPKATVAERRRADEELTGTLGIAIAEEPAGEAALRALAAFSPDVPAELLERGSYVDTLSLNSLPSSTIAALRKAYPTLQGGPDSIVVRRREFGPARSFGLMANLGIVDPGIVVPASWGIYAFALPVNPAPCLTDALLQAEAEKEFKLRSFATQIARLRAEETEGRALVQRYLAELPGGDFGPLGSLSQVAERWAWKGKDVIIELDPISESLTTALPSGKFPPKGDWSPRVVEGVLVLRPLLRFVNARRRWPLAALRALEATGAKPEMGEFGVTKFPSSEARAAYVRFAEPADRWGMTQYRGWPMGVLDNGASWHRVLQLVPPKILADADAAVKKLNANPPAPGGNAGDPRHEWKLPLAELSPAAQAAIAEEMRESFVHNGAHLLAYSPAAMSLYLQRGALHVQVNRYSRGQTIWYGRSATIWSDVPAFNAGGNSQLNGE